MEERLRRSTTDRVLFGVCGGLARYFDVDAVLIRVGFVVLVLAGGSGILLYLILALVMPSDDATTTEGRVGSRAAIEGDTAPRRRAEGLAAVLIIIGVVILLANLGLFSWFRWGTLWPLVLIGIGVLIIAQRYRRS